MENHGRQLPGYPGKKMESSSTETSSLGYRKRIRGFLFIDETTRKPIEFIEEVPKYSSKVPQEWNFSSLSKDSSTPSESGEKDSMSPVALENLPLRCVVGFSKSLRAPFTGMPDNLLSYARSLTPTQQRKLAEFIASFDDGDTRQSTSPQD